ncbi:MAG: DUF371 domain-containing protein [Candidatus Altiarchaeales archaeon]|nr:DUF371 domain-containing protein [Candidatus Altiarchaeales archaeon]
MAEEHITAWGHKNVSAMHKSTLMLTCDDHLTPAGDCIVAVNADKSAETLNKEVKKSLRGGCEVVLTLSCGGLTETVKARGDPRLTLTDAKDLVFRKSGFTCPRTVAVDADKAACDLDRGFIRRLREGRLLNATFKVVENK